MSRPFIVGQGEQKEREEKKQGFQRALRNVELVPHRPIAFTHVSPQEDSPEFNRLYEVHPESRMGGLQHFWEFESRSRRFDANWEEHLHEMIPSTVLRITTETRKRYPAPCKFTLILKVRYVKDGVFDVVATKSTDYTTTLSGIQANVERAYNEVTNMIKEKLLQGSGWTVHNIDSNEVNFGEGSPRAIGYHVNTPKSLADKHCVINPDNEDNNCFQYCLDIFHFALYPQQVGDAYTGPPPVTKNPQRTSIYRQKEYRRARRALNLQWGSLKPEEGVRIQDLDEFERLNPNYEINVLGWDESEQDAGLKGYVLRVSPFYGEQRKYVIHLCQLHEEPTGQNHFVLVTKYRLFFGDRHKTPKEVCLNCCAKIPCSAGSEAWTEHQRYCSRRQKPVHDVFPKKGFDEEYVTFQKYYKQLETPYFIMADMESLNLPIVGKARCTNTGCAQRGGVQRFTRDQLHPAGHESDPYLCRHCRAPLPPMEMSMEADKDEVFMDDEETEGEKKTKVLYEQRAHSAAFYVVCTYDYSKNRPVVIDQAHNTTELHADNSGNWGVRWLRKLFEVTDELIATVHSTNLPMEPLTEQEEREFEEATECSICHQSFAQMDGPFMDQQRVPDHNHLTGRYRGPAHRICNLNFNYVGGARTLSAADRAEMGIEASDLRKYARQTSRWRVPVFFHNMRGYDGHFIIQWLQDKGFKKIDVIAQNTEKFTAITVGDVRFLDSMLFFGPGASMDNLVNTQRGMDKGLEEEMEKYKKAKTFLSEERREDEDKHGMMAAVNAKLNSLLTQRDNNLEKNQKNFPFFHKEFERDFGRHVEEEYVDEAKRLCLQKGHYPYEYMDSLDRLQEPGLPSREAYATRLGGGKGLREEEYNDERRKWDLFKMQTMQDVHDLYLKLDVILMADVFERHRKGMFQSYGVDMTWECTAPGFAWTALFRGGWKDDEGKHHQTRLKLFNSTPEEILMHQFVEAGIRGGMCVVPRRYAYASNPDVPTVENPLEHNGEVPTYLLYVDANQLYSGAMEQYLPYDEYHWQTEQWKGQEDGLKEYILRTTDTQEWGAIFEVDLECPEELHDVFSDYPLAPEMRTMTKEELSTTMQQKMEEAHLRYTPTPKLMTTLHKKTCYPIHYRNLRQYLQLGWRMTKVHRVLAFRQVPWMRSFMQENVAKRKAAKSDDEKERYKLMNNSVFGKTMENVRQRMDYKMMRQGHDEEAYKRLVAGPKWKRGVLVAHNPELLGVELEQMKCKLDKPIIVGFSVLELSKTTMFDFYYNKVKKQYGENARLCMTDTDSLVLRIQTEDLYKELKDPENLMGQYMDFSSYNPLTKKGVNMVPSTHFTHFLSYYALLGDLEMGAIPIGEDVLFLQTQDAPHTCTARIPPNVLLSGYRPENNKKVSRFKDENGGLSMVEFCGHKPKCYCYRDVLGHTNRKAKGVPTKALKANYDMEQYKEVIRENKVFNIEFTRMSAQHHAVYVIERNMTALTGLDSKRWVLDNNIETLAFGHKRISEKESSGISSECRRQKRKLEISEC